MLSFKYNLFCLLSLTHSLFGIPLKNQKIYPQKYLNKVPLNYLISNADDRRDVSVMGAVKPPSHRSGPLIQLPDVADHASNFALLEPVDLAKKILLPSPGKPWQKCNNSDLQNIMKKVMNSSRSTSKQLIAEAARKHFGVPFDVICSRESFSYLTWANTYCEQKHNLLKCLAYTGF